MPHDEDVSFIDIEHQRTRNTLSDVLPGRFADRVGTDLSQHEDRRLTRLVLAVIHDICQQPPYDHVAGVRYTTMHRHWDAYVLWNPPMRVDLMAAESVRPVFPDDDDLLAAVRMLGLEAPDS